MRRLFITKNKTKDVRKAYHIKLLDDNYSPDTVLEMDATQLEISYLDMRVEYIYVLIATNGNMNKDAMVKLLVDYVEQTWNELPKGGSND
jgi:hypothetical protein